MRNHFPIWGATALLFLTACLSEPTATPTQMPTATPTPLRPSPSPLPSQTASPIPSQTPSPVPTETPTLTGTLTPTPKPVSFPIFGVEMNPISTSGGLDLVAQAGTYWVRRNSGVLWSEIEPREGTLNWGVLADLEKELRDAASKGMRVILIVRSTPAWAQKVPGSYCGPIKAAKLAAFANFMRDLVSRYSAAPYNVKYWELWNEPDVDPALVDHTSEFGCWGDQKDDYYGGGYYAQMLRVVYPQIKGADPQAQVLVGGLLLDCDPDNPPTGKDCKPARFLEGILRNNGGPFFDGVSFHAYDYYLGALGQYSNTNWQSAWNTTGPAALAKSRYLRKTLELYGSPNKFLMNTETALLCGQTGEEPYCRTDVFNRTKAAYVAQSFAVATASDWRANVWYSVFGWRASGLLNPSNRTPLPAFDAYRFTVRELHLARFVREVQDYPGVRGYEFERDGRRLWVLWSLDGTNHSVALPALPRAIFDVFGTSVPVGSWLTVTLMPLYVNWD